MTRQLHIVLGCSNRKTSRALASTRLGSISDPRRALCWQERLDGTPRTIRADQLYAGEAWQEGLKIGAEGRTRFDTTIWVLSGGFGLVREDHLLCSYSATLTPGHADSVPRAGSSRRAENRAWMRAMSAWRGAAANGDPRTLTDLVAANRNCDVLICAGPVYLDAVVSDLRSASERGSNADSVIVFGSAKRPLDGLDDQWVHTPGRLRTALGGSLASVAARAAQVVVREAPLAGPTVATARTTVSQLLASSTALPTYQRERLSNDLTLAWIARHLERTPNASATSALRALRQCGYACEQGLFGELFKTARSQFP